MAGQLSTASGTPSTSASSSTVEQLPVLTTPVLTQTSWEIPTQVFVTPPVQSWSRVQTVAGVLLQVPDIGHPVGPVSVVQTMLLERLQEPVASAAMAAPWQSPSQASPSLSWSALAWPGLYVRTQLSLLSWMPSPSRSLVWLHAIPCGFCELVGICSGS